MRPTVSCWNSGDLWRLGPVALSLIDGEVLGEVIHPCPCMIGSSAVIYGERKNRLSTYSRGPAVVGTAGKTLMCVSERRPSECGSHDGNVNNIHCCEKIWWFPHVKIHRWVKQMKADLSEASLASESHFERQSFTRKLSCVVLSASWPQMKGVREVYFPKKNNCTLKWWPLKYWQSRNVGFRFLLLLFLLKVEYCFCTTVFQSLSMKAQY